jgi:hypothetical protein
VSDVLLITADRIVSRSVRRTAEQEGVHVVEHHTAQAAEPYWAHAPMVLLGHDLLDAAKAMACRYTGRLIVVSATRPSIAGMIHAGSVQPEYVVVVRFATTALRPVLKQYAAGTLARLTAAGYPCGHADRALAQVRGYVRPDEISPRPLGITHAVYGSFGAVARGDAPAAQADARQRSNFAALHDRFPTAWTDTVSEHVTQLGGFLCDLPAAAVDALCRLALDPVLQNLDAGERDDVTASWLRWVRSAVYIRLRRRSQAVWHVLDDDEVTRLWWQVVDGMGCRPADTGRIVQWDLERLVPAFAARLLTEFRRHHRRDPRYQIAQTTAVASSTGRYLVHDTASRSPIGEAPTRFDAGLLAWRHQRVTEVEDTAQQPRKFAS